MNESTVRHHAVQSVSVARIVDQICTSFERALRNGEKPSIEGFLDQIGQSERSEVLRQLLAIELEHRTQEPEANHA